MVVGTGLLVLTGSFLSLLILGTGLVTGIIALKAKGEPNTVNETVKVETPVAPRKKTKSRRHPAAIVALVVVTGGLIAFFIAMSRTHL